MPGRDQASFNSEEIFNDEDFPDSNGAITNLAEGISIGEIPIESLSDGNIARLTALVREKRRKRIVRFIAKQVASDLIGQYFKEQNKERNDVNEPVRHQKESEICALRSHE